jgi:hypothetical protein
MLTMLSAKIALLRPQGNTAGNSGRRVVFRTAAPCIWEPRPEITQRARGGSMASMSPALGPQRRNPPSDLHFSPADFCYSGTHGPTSAVRAARAGPRLCFRQAQEVDAAIAHEEHVPCHTNPHQSMPGEQIDGYHGGDHRSEDRGNVGIHRNPILPDRRTSSQPAAL